MENGKKIILWTIIIIILFIIILSILFINNKNAGFKVNEKINNLNFKEEDSIEEYIKIDQTINGLFKYYINGENEHIEDIINNSKKEILSTNNEYKIFNSKKIYVQEIAQKQDIRSKILFINGMLYTENSQYDVYIQMRKDLINNTYDIEIIDEEKFNKIIKDKGIDEIEFSIQPNDYNKLEYIEVNDYQICSKYLNDFISIVNRDIEKAYNMLIESSKTNEFSSLKDFEEFINKYIKNNEVLVEKYKVDAVKKEYICVDENQNYYIFKENKPLEYKVFIQKNDM